MFNLILVLTDSSELAEKAIKAAVSVAQFHKGKVIELPVGEPFPSSPIANQVFYPDSATYNQRVQEFADAGVKKYSPQRAAQTFHVTC